MTGQAEIEAVEELPASDETEVELLPDYPNEFSYSQEQESERRSLIPRDVLENPGQHA